MNIEDGNIFQVMRLVLPEHRAVMKEWTRSRSEKAPLSLEEDELEQMQYTLSEAIENKSRVRLTMFEKQGDVVLEGVPVFDGRLRLVMDETVRAIHVEKLIRIEMAVSD